MKHRYLVHKQERALERAREFLAEKDPASARLELEIALAAVPGSQRAIGVAADLFDQVGSPQALTLAGIVVDAPPASIPARVAMASTALRLKDFNAAREALKGIPASGAADPTVLRANLAYALAMDQRPLADMLFDRIDALGQQTDETQALHAMLRRLHPDPEKAAAARAELEKLAENPDYALVIHRTLYSDALVLKDYVSAKRHAALASAHPDAKLDDRLNEANLAILFDRQPFAEVFARVSPGANADGASAASFTRWLLVQQKTDEADRWLAELPEAVAKSPEVLALRADRAVVAKDWVALNELVTAGAWGPLAPKVMENAFAAQAIAGSGREDTARKPLWSAAVTAAGSDRRSLMALLRWTRVWGWPDETEQLLFAIVRADPNQTWAHTALMEEFQRRGDGAKMLEVITILKNAAPKSSTYRHDWVVLTLLSAPTAKWDAGKDLAREIAQGEPTNTTYAVTYALALAQSGKVAEARALIEQLPAAARALFRLHLRAESRLGSLCQIRGNRAALVVVERRTPPDRGREIF